MDIQSNKSINVSVGDLLYRAEISNNNIVYRIFAISAITAKGFWITDGQVRVWKTFNTKFASCSEKQALHVARDSAFRLYLSASSKLKDAERRVRLTGGVIVTEDETGGFEFE